MYTVQDYIQFINPKLFFCPQSSHGVMHTYRVMILATELANKLDITTRDYHILMCACCYHDIGRWHDFKDKKHGHLSAQKCLRKHTLNPFALDEYEVMLVSSIITFHSLPDAEFPLQSHPARLLYDILKDADALDRWRFKKMDASCLRLPESKELSSFAKDLVLKYPYNYKYKELGIK